MTTSKNIVAKLERVCPTNPDKIQTVSVEYSAFIKRFFLSIPAGSMGNKGSYTDWGGVIEWAKAHGFKFVEVNVA